ncbi:MAG: DUF2334 domain-containing protein, partial [Burkholderiaceae bacterium]
MTGRSLCIVLHNVAPPTWKRCRALLGFLDDMGLGPVTLLAVPRFHGAARDPAFERWLCERQRSGDEVSLHGYNHQDGGPARNPVDWLRRNVYTRGEGEFCDISFELSRGKLQAGLQWMQDLGISPAGFVAPAWLLGAESWRALQT